MYNLESRLEVEFGADSVRAGVWVWVWLWEIMASKGFCAKVKRS